MAAPPQTSGTASVDVHLAAVYLDVSAPNVAKAIGKVRKLQAHSAQSTSVLSSRQMVVCSVIQSLMGYHTQLDCSPNQP